MPKKYNAEEWKSRIEEAIKNSTSMIEAARYCGLERKTFNRMSKELGLFKPNPSGKGVPSQVAIPLEEIFNGNQYLRPNFLKKRLYIAGLKEKKCEICGITSWNGKDIVFHLHHKDGNNKNNNFNNLQIVCPNCHSQTENYCRSKTTD